MEAMQNFHIQINPQKSYDYRTVYKFAFALYRDIASTTKRRPYIRSKFFKKEKIFLAIFWQHIHEKNWHERKRRLRYFACGLELIRCSSSPPITIENPHRSSELLHRFRGMTPNKEIFFVQIKESKENKQKYLISIFPEN